MTTYTALRFLHIVSAILFIGGILGSHLLMGIARRKDDLRVVSALSQAAARFEQWMIMPGNLLVIVFGVLVALDGGWPIFGFLEGDGEKSWLLTANILLVINLVIVATLYIPRGKALGRKLNEAMASGGNISAIRAELDAPVIQWAHYFDYASLIVILYLMSFKPF